jgi:osmotically-inducible protein OsmY
MQGARRTGAAARTDGEIARDILRKMKDDVEVPDDRLRVRVAAGVVTIEGSVTHDFQKAAAERCARRVKGVREVINRIEVEPAAAPLEAR